MDQLNVYLARFHAFNYGDALEMVFNHHLECPVEASYLAAHSLLAWRNTQT